MGRYLIRRGIISIVTLIAISAIIYSILFLAPGDPLGELAANPNVSPEVRQRIRESYGLDDPLYIQYFKWAKSYFIDFDWGTSFTSRMPVKDYLLDRIGVSLSISGTAFILGLMIAIPVGVVSAVKQYSAFDNIATTFAFIGYSIPTFFSGLLLILLFSVKLGWLPFIYNANVDSFWGDRQTIDHACHRPGDVLVGTINPLYEVVDVGDDQSGLCADRPRQRPARADRDHCPCHAQRDDPGRHDHRPPDSRP